MVTPTRTRNRDKLHQPTKPSSISKSTIKKLHLHDDGDDQISTRSCKRSSLINKMSGQDGDDDTEVAAGCCTPKGKRFRIPETVSCPPAPKKRRVGDGSTSKSSCSVDSSSTVIRAPMSFFASPEIELFFSALHPERPPDNCSFICR